MLIHRRPPRELGEPLHAIAHVGAGGFSSSSPVTASLIPLLAALTGTIVGARLSLSFPIAGAMVGFVVGLVGGGIAVQIADA
jgi:hypothetical protein